MEKRRSYGQACEFCAKRKIKCSGVFPCDSCTKRGRGDCRRAQPLGPSRSMRRHLGASKHTSALDAEAGRQSRGDPSLANSRSCVDDSLARCVGSNVQRVDNAQSPDGILEQPPLSQLGANSMPSFVETAAAPSHINHLQDMRPALGLQNASNQYPFMITGGETGEQSPHLPFSHAQVLKYTQVYESVVSPLFPFVPSYDDLEVLILSVLERSAEVGIESTDGTLCGQPMDHSSTSLVCAVLACGAQMSDDQPAQRLEQSRMFAQQAFNYARFANFLLRPNRVTVYAMLLLSFYLQNDGQADAAWSLLGTVSRLAMAIGSYKPLPCTGVPSVAEGEDNIWMTVKWQDCLLSVCFDRVVLAPPLKRLDSSGEAVSAPRKYLDLMKTLMGISHQWLSESDTSRNSISTISGYIDLLDALDLDNDDSGQVQSLCRTRRRRIEHFVLRLHGGYIRSVICRPALSTMGKSGKVSRPDKILGSAIQGISQTLCAYIALSKLTKLPLRTWSMIHAGLSSAIMVEFVESFSGPSALRQAQAAFLDLLTREEKDATSGNGAGNPAWLSSSHSGYLRALRDVLQQREQHGLDPAPCDKAADATWLTATGIDEFGADRMYEHAKKTLASIGNTGESTLDLPEFDWSLASWDLDAMTSLDATLPSFYL